MWALAAHQEQVVPLAPLAQHLLPLGESFFRIRLTPLNYGSLRVIRQIDLSETQVLVRRNLRLDLPLATRFLSPHAMPAAAWIPLVLAKVQFPEGSCRQLI